MRTHGLRISYYLLFAVITVSSVLYLLADFKTYDVTPSVRSYGVVQLVLTLILVLILLTPSANRYEKTVMPVAYNIILLILLLIQIIPAVLWILFDRRAVAEYPWDSGVIGSWIYGAYHIAVMLWGIVIFSRHRLTNKP